MIGGTDPNDGTPLTQAAADIQAALTTLQRLGRSDQADTLLTDAEQSNSYDYLDNDTEHNDAWKLQRYAATYTGVMSTLARKLTAAANLAGTQDANDAATVYGVKGLAGDVASLAISRRDAGDRVADITDPARLPALLEQAVRTGDDVLAHAIAEAAIKGGDEATADQFAAAYPNLSDAVDRLWSAEHRKMTGQDIAVAWRVSALKPRALASKMDYEIASIAAGQTSAGSWNVG